MNLVLHVCGQYKIKNAKAKKKVYEYKEEGMLYGIKRLYRVKLMHGFILADRISIVQVLSCALHPSRTGLICIIQSVPNKTVRIILFLIIIGHAFDKINPFKQIAVCV